MKPGDKVRIDGMKATVLCDVDAGEYSTEYPAADWADVLKSGILVETIEIGSLTTLTPVRWYYCKTPIYRRLTPKPAGDRVAPGNRPVFKYLLV
jgi:hypothetical protein